MKPSELAKRLKGFIADVGAARGPAKYIMEERLANLGRFVWDHEELIISALQTVAGIERLAAKGIGVFIDTTSIPDTVIVSWSETREASVGDDLHSAVSAAVEASEK